MSGYVLDDTLITAFAHGDAHVTHLIASLDARKLRMAAPANVLVVSQAGLSDEQCETLNAVVAHVEHVMLDDLSDLDHITALAHALGWLGSPHDVAAAHAAAVAKRLDWPVLTLDAARWQLVSEKLPWKVPLVELREP
ncbi:hypothetical protein ACL02S_23515 [Nocardia sp. 004]|uniref:hypothetical protein n=1 Tax=Nocardia sp. 004 TaxID=3385978 RepID=UPI0039A34015